ncbi:hypothetical protein A3Q56_04571, partial [Intoshia linei]
IKFCLYYNYLIENDIINEKNIEDFIIELEKSSFPIELILNSVNAEKYTSGIIDVYSDDLIQKLEDENKYINNINNCQNNLVKIMFYQVDLKHEKIDRMKIIVNRSSSIFDKLHGSEDLCNFYQTNMYVMNDYFQLNIDKIEEETKIILEENEKLSINIYNKLFQPIINYRKGSSASRDKNADFTKTKRFLYEILDNQKLLLDTILLEIEIVDNDSIDLKKNHDLLIQDVDASIKAIKNFNLVYEKDNSVLNQLVVRFTKLLEDKSNRNTDELIMCNNLLDVLHDSVHSEKIFKKSLMNWCNSVLQCRDVSNFTTVWNDKCLIICLIKKLFPNKFPIDFMKQSINVRYIDGSFINCEFLTELESSSIAITTSGSFSICMGLRSNISVSECELVDFIVQIRAIDNLQKSEIV